MEVQAGVVDVNGTVRMHVQGDVGISRHLCRYEDWGWGVCMNRSGMQVRMMSVGKGSGWLCLMRWIT